jgi:hypothetical protein
MEANHDRQLSLQPTHTSFPKQEALPLEVIDEKASLQKGIQIWHDAYRWTDILFASRGDVDHGVEGLCAADS